MPHLMKSPSCTRTYVSFLFWLIFLLSLLKGTSAQAQGLPVNDNCGGAISLTPGVTCSPSNGISTGATQTLPACAAGGIADDDVWFQFVATKMRHGIRVTCSANYDAVIEVFSGSCNNLTSLICTDATGLGAMEMSQPDSLIPGNTYYVRVYHYKAGAGSGNFTICISDPSNDNCDGAVSLPVNTTHVPVSGTIQNATESMPPCGGPGYTANDVWYKFKATGVAHDVEITASSGLQIEAQVLVGTCNSLSSIQCGVQAAYGSSATIQLAPLVMGQTYFVRLYANNHNITTNTFTISVKDRPMPPGALCVNALNIPGVPFKSGLQTTCGSGDNYRSNFRNYSLPGEDLVYKLEVTNAPVSYLMRLDRPSATASNLWVSVFKDCPTPALQPSNFVGESPLSRSGVADSSIITLKTNGTYYFVVDGQTCGDFRFSLKNAPPPPVNDECINAITVTVGDTCSFVNASSLYATQSRPSCIPSGNTINAFADDDTWYSFVAKGTKHQVYVQGSFELFSGSCGNLTSMLCFTQGSNTNRTDLPNLVPGQTYYFRVYLPVAGISNSQLRFCITQLRENDDCIGAITLPVAPINTVPVPFAGSTKGTTQSMPSCQSPTIAYANDDVWFKFVATSPYQLIKVVGLPNNAATPEFAFNPVVELFSGSCNSLNSLVCMNRYINAQNPKEELRTDNLTPGNTYYLRVYDYRTDATYDKFTISVQEDSPAPVGAVCATAVPVTAIPFNSGQVSTCGSQDNYGSDCRGGGSLPLEDYVFRLDITNAPVSYQMTLSSGSTTSKMLNIYRNCPSPAFSPTNCAINTFGQLLYTNQAGRDSTSSNIFSFNTNGTYYLVVEDALFQGMAAGNINCGNFNLKINPAPLPPGNDLCANAITLPVSNNCTPVSGTTILATSSGAAQSCMVFMNPGVLANGDTDVWYKFVATASSHNITVQGLAGFQPGIQLLQGACPTPTILACNIQQSSTNAQVMYATNLTAGNTYFVKVFDTGGGTGEFTICVTDAPPRPVGSSCSNPFIIPAIPFNSGLQTTCGKGNDFGMIQSSYNFPINGQSPRYGDGEDYVFQLNVTNAPVTYAFTLGGNSIRKGLRILNQCNGQVTFMGLNNQPFIATGLDTSATLPFTFTSNGTYYLVVDTWPQPHCADFRLNIRTVNPPVNDNCAGAINLTAGSTCVAIEGNISEATASIAQGCFNTTESLGKDLWYKFTATSARKLTVSIQGNPNFHPQLRLYADTCGNLRPVECNYNFNGGNNLTHSYFNLPQGVTYYLRVNTTEVENYGTGKFTICITEDTTPVNATCQQAVTVPVNASGICNAVSGTITGTLLNQGLPVCSGNAAGNAWYRFTATNANQRIKVSGSAGFDAVVQVFGGNCNNPALLHCSDNTSLGATETVDAAGLTVGDTYFVRVYHYGPGWGSGDFTICVQELPTPPVNDDCNGAITLTASTTCQPVTGTVLNATQTLAGCSGASAADVWYKFTAIGVENVITVTNPGNADLVVELLSGSCGALSSVMCRDTALAGGGEMLKAVGTLVGSTYYVRVYAYNQKTGTGDFSICVQSSSSRAVMPLPLTNSSFCAGEQFMLPYRVFGSFQAGNEFQAQLSDSSGSFTNPVIVGSLISIDSDTLLVHLPVTSKQSNLYKLRLTASGPAYISPVIIPLSITSIPAMPQIVMPPEYCLGETVAALQVSGSNISWYSDSLLTNLVHSGPTYTPIGLTATTTYFITQKNGSCESVPAKMTVIIKPLPNSAFNTLNPTYCTTTQPINLIPAVPGGTFSGSLVFGNTFIPALPGSYTISYTLTRNGCTSTTTQNVQVLTGPVANAGLNRNICSGETIALGTTPIPGLVYNWSPTSGISNPAIANPNFTAGSFLTRNDTILKQLLVTDTLTGCSSTALVSIIVRGVPVVSAGSDTLLCAGTAPYALQGTPAGGNWSGSSGISGSGFDPAVAGTGLHTLVYTFAQNGCFATDTLKIIVQAKPPTPVITAINRDSLTSGVVAGTYEWLLNGISTGLTTAGIKPTQSGSYQVIIWNNGCASDTSVVFGFVMNGIKPGISIGKFNVFPNPSTGSTTLYFQQPGVRNISVEISDALGRQVYKRAYKTNLAGEVTQALDLSGLANGLYLLQINTPEHRYYQKLVIEK
ncbi:T9SS type A sorting domain-containing protein [Adhaeribacter sp. BT258]|uniref:T9SS type A sorting domain-containing protein n=1 Tax=Adhaeribacter terrigena TaxID=2793070 RepID=A0ABS1BWQ9_9BACT|nr:T9SS type A sorting domain-containing protein [Adhaeribacter terrigena]MBK0401577.1 T9SS type A sorting domain-containing protein [Adhaeribacter terrigena]